MQVNGELIRAGFERLTADPAATATSIGRGIFRTDTKVFKIQVDATTWVSLVDLASAQTLQNKILSAPEFTGASTYSNLIADPSNPVAGKVKFYPQDGKFFILDENGAKIEVGSGSGSKNYIANPDAASDTAATNSTANVSVARIAATTGQPENSKGTSFEITATAAAIDGTDYFEWEEDFVWDKADARTVSLGVVKSLVLTGSWAFQAWNHTDGVAAGPLTSTIIDDTFVRVVVYPVAEKAIRLRAIPKEANSSLRASGISLTAVTTRYGSSGKRAEYVFDDTDGSNIVEAIFGFGITAWGVLLVPYKTNRDTWRLAGTVAINFTGAQLAPRFKLLDVSVATNPGTATTTLIACSAMNGGANVDAAWVYTDANPGNPNEFQARTGVTSTVWSWEFDVPLTHKPSWVDFDDTTQTIDQAEEENAQCQFTFDSGGTALVVGATPNPIPVDTLSVDFENLGNWSSSGGIIPIPVSGNYQIRSSNTIQPAPSDFGLRLEVDKKDGNGFVNQNPGLRVGEASNQSVDGGIDLYLEAGWDIKKTVSVSNIGVFRSRLTIVRIPRRTGSAIGLPFATEEVSGVVRKVTNSTIVTQGTAGGSGNNTLGIHTNSPVTVPSTGGYLVSFSIEQSGGPSGQAFVFRNGAALSPFSIVNGASRIGAKTLTAFVNLLEGDVLDIRSARTGGSGSAAWLYPSILSITKISV